MQIIALKFEHTLKEYLQTRYKVRQMTRKDLFRLSKRFSDENCKLFFGVELMFHSTNQISELNKKTQQIAAQILKQFKNTILLTKKARPNLDYKWILKTV